MSDLALALTIVSIQIALLATFGGGIVIWYRRRYWHRRLHALPAYAASIAAASAGDHAKSLELARAVQERTRRWRGPAAAAGAALLGDRLVRLRQWPEALPHLRSAVVGLRGVRGGQGVLVVALMDAALAYDAVNQPADALPLMEEQLELMVRSGEGQRRPEIYRLALRQWVELLRRLGRFDEAIRLGEEALVAIEAADPGGAPASALLFSLTMALRATDRPEDVAQYAQRLIDRNSDQPPGSDKTPGKRQFLAIGWYQLGRARFALGQYAAAVEAYATAVPIFEDVAAARSDGNVLGLAAARTAWAAALIRAGRLDDAESAVVPVPDLIRDVKTGPAADREDAWGELAVVQAEISAERGRLGEARELVTAAERHLLTAQTGRVPGDVVDLRPLRSLQQRLATS